MSFVKLLRGNIAYQVLKKIELKNDISINTKKLRCLSTLSTPVPEKNVLTSKYGIVDDEEITITDHVFRYSTLWPDKPGLTCAVSGRSYEYGMLRMMVERCAKALISHLKLSPGDRAGLILPNIPEFAVVIHGAMKAGLVVTFTNPLYTTDEIRRQFTDCNVKVIATIEMFMPVAMEVSKHLKDYKGTIWVDGEDDKVKGKMFNLINTSLNSDMYTRIFEKVFPIYKKGNTPFYMRRKEKLSMYSLEADKNMEAPFIDLSKRIHGLRSLLLAAPEVDLPKVDPNDVCLIPYSSGTMGMPKGVMLTHKNLVANVKQLCRPEFMKNRGALGTGLVTLTAPPFFHIFGFNSVLNYNLTIGNHLVAIPKFTPEDYIKTFIKYRPKSLFLVPSLLVFLAGHPDVKKEYLQSVESITIGGAPATASMLEKFLQKVGKTKDEFALLQGYGMTETSPVMLVTPYVYPHDKAGTIGQVVPSTQIKIVSLTTGEALGPNQAGEVLIKGPQIMKGYLNNEAATKEIIDDEGWLHTGDVAYYDKEEFFYIVDRTKELIKVKGNQVSPTEIETLIMELPEVADVAVIGISDEKAGELPKAFVVLKKNKKLTEKQIYNLVASKLIKYKHLQGGVEFIDAIPRNIAGKIMRNKLKV